MNDQITFDVKISVINTPVHFAPVTVSVHTPATVQPIVLPIKQAMEQEFKSKTFNKIKTYFDEDRVLKTVLNFGNNFQSLITNWAYDPQDTTQSTILLKLYRPLPRTIRSNTKVWIDREIAFPWIDQVVFVFVPGQGLKTYLRPANTNIASTKLSGIVVDNVTETTLYSTGAFNPVRPSDQVLEEWYVTSIEGAELNREYNDYSSFVFFGSAAARLQAFKNKLLLLEDFNRVLTINSSSLAGTGSAYITGSVAYNSIQNIANQRLDIIRSFDGYERFLYYSSGSSYSSSFGSDTDDELFYHTDCTWPKTNGVVDPVASSSTWYTTQYNIASEYDSWNVNYLVNNIPEFIKTDDASADFVQFLNLIGHQFDTVKTYIDDMTSIYDRNSNALTGMSQDIVWNVAKSFGVDLPNQYALKSISDYTVGPTTTKVFRQFAAETWKRLLHNQVYFSKTKGTKQSLRGLLNAYGISPSAIQIRETSTPPATYSSHSYQVIDEFRSGLKFTSGSFSGSSALRNHSHIVISGALQVPVKTFQMRFNLPTIDPVEILETTGQTSAWSLMALPYTESVNTFNTPSNQISFTGSKSTGAGYIALRTYRSDGNTWTTVLSSSILPNLFTGKFHTLQLSTDELNNLSLGVAEVVQDNIDTFSWSTLPSGNVYYSLSGTANPTTAGNRVILGGSNYIYNLGLPEPGANSPAFFVYPTGSGYFDGVIDEFRMWDEPISQSNFRQWSLQPDAYFGNTTESYLNTLSVKLSFNKPINLSANPFYSQSIVNESPAAISGAYKTYSDLQRFAAHNFETQSTYPYNYEFNNRTIIRYTPNIGTQYDTNKIVIADDPVYAYISGTSIPVLSRERSIVTVDTKNQLYRRANNTIGMFFSPTDTQNTNIVNSIGLHNLSLGNLIGDPEDIISGSYSDLDSLKKRYAELNPYVIDQNRFIDFFKNLFGAMFEQAKTLVPAKAKLLTGILIEPTILERNKMKVSLPQYENLYHEAYIGSTHPDDVTAELPFYETECDTLESYEATALMPQYDTLINTSESYYMTTIDMFSDDTYPVDAIDLENYRLLSRKTMATYLPISGPYTESLYMMPSYGPISDFLNDLGAVEYFTNKLGYIGVPTTLYVRTQQNILRNKGTWSSGSTYIQNDYVVDSGSSNYGEYFVHVPGTFNSYIPPHLDPAKWRPVAYRPVADMDIRKVIVINGTLSIAPTGSSQPFPVGYRSNHYSKTRDYRLGIIRHQYLGCLQTQDTTVDGKTPVEIIPSVGDTLFVNATADQIKPTSNPGGPILDVR